MIVEKLQGKKTAGFYWNVFFLLTLLIPNLLWNPVSLRAQPPGFINEIYVGGWDQVVGLTLDENGRMYAWEKKGVVHIVENGVKLPVPLIDISAEVGNWQDHGLMSFALDPDFLLNGYVYLYYVVDRHHLLNFGTPAYDPAQNEYYAATIARITRYTAEPGTNLSTVDMNSRLVLLGESPSTGIPILEVTHGAGTILFGDDGTLIASSGDGAGFLGTDAGGTSYSSYASAALIDGIINLSEDVGAFRAQMLDSHNGKVLRLNPLTGDAIPSNPYYDPTNPRSAKSRTWALGLRNPSRMTIRPNTGNPDPLMADPGTLYLGDVGYNTWEELNIAPEGGLNFGWPLYEGMFENDDYYGLNMPNTSTPAPVGCNQAFYSFNQVLALDSAGVLEYPDPCQPGQQISGTQYQLFRHTRPAFDWAHFWVPEPNGKARVRTGDVITKVGSGPVAGPQWEGNCSIGGTWYQGNDFPAIYAGSYFHADYDKNWIRNFDFDANEQPQEVRDFTDSAGFVVYMISHPSKEGIFYINYSQSGAAEIHWIRYQPNANQSPTAIIELDTLYGPSPLTVQFDGVLSNDPEGDSLSYQWDFGDGTPGSTGIAPSHVFTTPSGLPAAFEVTLGVSDTAGNIDQEQVIVSVNNTPPVIVSTSIDTIDFYSLASQTSLQLEAVVTDLEHLETELNYSWEVVFHHNTHVHAEPLDTNRISATVLAPVGCDADFWYRIKLAVGDPAGLKAEYEKDIFPDCDTPIGRVDRIEYPQGGSILIPVLSNDLAFDGIDSSSVMILRLPSLGTATYFPGTGEIEYVHNGLTPGNDTLSYRFLDLDGDSIEETIVSLFPAPPATILLTQPTQNEVVVGSSVALFYQLSGFLGVVDHIRFTLDDSLIREDFDITGTYVFDGIGAGIDHELIAQLVDAQGQILPNPEATATREFSVSCQTEKGSILREFWRNIPGDSIAFLTSHPDYPEKPTSRNEIAFIQAPIDQGDNYGTRLRGYLHPPDTGKYVFYLVGDDFTTFYLSTDSTAAQIVPVAFVPGWTSSNDFFKFPSQISDSIYMEKGRKYYIELLHKEALGGDHFSVYWKIPSVDSSELVRGAYLSPWVECVYQESTTGLDEGIAVEPIHIYPNPVQVSETLFVTLPKGHAPIEQIRFIDLLGKSVGIQPRDIQLTGSELRMTVPSQLAAGMYVLQVKTAQSLFRSRLWIKQN